MVNTRRTSQALQSDDSRSQAAEQSDSSTTSTARRTTRRSVGNLPKTPGEIPTPPRRSRRLSNSSIESANNDTPRPTTRRSTRSKATGSDNDTSDVELVVIKRRKLVEGVDTLIPISEEKTEEHASSTKGKENHILVELDEEREEETRQKPEITDVSYGNQQNKVVNATSAESVGIEKIKSSPKIENSRSPVKIENGEPQVQKGETKSTISANIKSPVKVAEVDHLDCQLVHGKALEVIVSPKRLMQVDLVKEKVDEVDKSSRKYGIAVPTIIVDVCKEKLHSIEEQNQENYFTPVSTPTNLEDLEDTTKQVKKAVCITNDEQQLIITTDEAEIFSTGNNIEQEAEDNKPSDLSSIQETDTMPTAGSPVKSDVEKPRMLFGVPANRITVNKTLMMKKTKKRNPVERKLRRTRKKVEPAKESLPCGADIMRNIPRGKSKSGREWKEPKSNPRYLYQDKGLKMPFEKITQLRQERQRVKELENRMKEEERARRAEITRRRMINKQREEENARRGEVVQVIRNTNKIKRMKKKQLKLIQKRDTTKVV